MGVYDRQIKAAKRIISVYGENVKWNVTPEGNGMDKPWLPADGNGTAPVTETHNVDIAFFPIGSDIRKVLHFMNDTNVVIGDIVGYMAQVDFEPSLKDTIERKDGSIWRFESIDALDPNGEGVILYTLGLKS